MKILVYSREQAIRKTRSLGPGAVVISITDPGSPRPEFPPGIPVHRFEFHDWDVRPYQEGDEMGYEFISMGVDPIRKEWLPGPAMAKQIGDVIRSIDPRSLVIIHGENGVSRSSAVALAICVHFDKMRRLLPDDIISEISMNWIEIKPNKALCMFLDSELMLGGTLNREAQKFLLKKGWD